MMKKKLSKLERNQDRYSETQRWLLLSDRDRQLEYNIKNPEDCMAKLKAYCERFGLDMYGNPISEC